MNSRRRAELILLTITIIWGSTFVITKSLLVESSPLFYSGLRFLAASVILLIFAFRTCTLAPGGALTHGMVLGALLYIGFILQTIGLNYTTASKAAFFTGMLVPFTPIVHFASQRIFGTPRRSLKYGNVFGVLCAAGGLYLLTSPEGSGFTIGDFLNLLCAVFFALYIVYLDLVPREVNKLQLTFIQFLFCGIVGTPVALFFEEVRLCTSPECLLGFGYLIVFATIITMWMQNRYQGDTTPTRAAVIFAIEPVVAALFAYIFRDESIGTAGFFGGAIVMGGLFLSEFADSIPLLKSPVGGSPGG